MKFNRCLPIFLAATVALLPMGCGTNPVTKKSEVQLVSESNEIAMGKENYLTARQSQGGDYVIDPDLTAYVQSVGNKLAAVSDRNLPYEFVVLNNSIPNAWAMPGGKIAINRGLLYELNSEAELAAVLGHEIVHAAARHGAKSMERGMLLQGAALAVGILTQDSSYANLIVGSGQLSSQLISTKYSRDAESESDLYGMQYMKKAGYDPRAAVALQETFVRLSKNKSSNFMEGLFASHPPSEERVAANKLTLTRLGEGGEWGREVYAQKVGKLKSTQVAYQSYDEGVKSLSKGDTVKATSLAMQALASELHEARFQELLGDIELSKKNYDEALNHYFSAIKMQPDYFKPHVQSGIAFYNSDRKTEAAIFLTRGNELLSTAPSHYLLGDIAESSGDSDGALKHFQVAASSNSEIGKASIKRYIQLDFPRNPSHYLKGHVEMDNNGSLKAIVANTSQVVVSRFQFHVVRYADKNMRKTIVQSMPIYTNTGVGANQSISVLVSDIRPSVNDDLKLFRVIVDSAELG